MVIVEWFTNLNQVTSSSSLSSLSRAAAAAAFQAAARVSLPPPPPLISYDLTAYITTVIIILQVLVRSSTQINPRPTSRIDYPSTAHPAAYLRDDVSATLLDSENNVTQANRRRSASLSTCFQQRWALGITKL